MKKIPFIFFLAFLCVSACLGEPTMAELNPSFESRIAQALKPEGYLLKNIEKDELVEKLEQFFSNKKISDQP